MKRWFEKLIALLSFGLLLQGCGGTGTVPSSQPTGLQNSSSATSPPIKRASGPGCGSSCPSISASQSTVSGGIGTSTMVDIRCYKGNILYSCSGASASSSNVNVATASTPTSSQYSTSTISLISGGAATITYSWNGATATVAVTVYAD